MLDSKVTDKQMKNWIVITIGTGGASWKKLNRILRINGPMSQLKRVLKGLERSGHVYLERNRYQLTKKGLEIYEILNAPGARSNTKTKIVY